MPYNLLLLADPSKNLIEAYLKDSKVFLAKMQEDVLGILALKVEGDSAEIMNVAVSEDQQGKGVGSRLITHSVNYCKENAINKLLIGTADTSESQLRLYKKLGFRPYDRLSNFFIDNYQEPIFENGRQARDMIRLELSLS